MAKQRDPRKALSAFIESNNLPKRQAAAALGVSHVSLHEWLTGTRTPSAGPQRDAIARWTNGAVPAEWWESPEERKRREQLQRVEPFKPTGT